MLTNKGFSKICEEFAELMELKGDIRFKIIAYQKASRAINDLPKPLVEIYEEGGVKALEEIDGIGEGIAEKIEEYIKTGKIKELEKLKNNFPKSEINYLKIPGVGPSTSKILFDKFGSGSIETLSTKLSKGGHKVFQEKTLKKILRGIEIYKNLGDRMLLSEAMEISEPIVKYIEEKCFGEKVEAVGSLRRRKETIGDIDIIATSRNKRKTIELFSKYSELEQIIAKGDTKLTGILKNSKQVDLEILEDKKYGSLLLHFTGSKQHNVALRSFAQKKGLSISEHGIKNEKTGKPTLYSSEKDVYEMLDLKFIEPELREDRGEIEVALEGQLPNLVELSDIRGDLHIHSKFSDGLASVEELAKKALELKYEYIAIADHTESLGIAGGANEGKFLARRKEIEAVRKKFPNLKILDSCEVNIMSDGALDMKDEFLKSFDVVTASIHSGFSQSKEQITERLISSINNPFVDIIAHPTGRILNHRPGYEADWEEIFAACKKNKVALEINSHPNRLDLVDYLIIEAKKSNLLFAINTDLHSLGEFDNIRLGVYTARRGWLEKKDIINCMSYEKLKQCLRKKI